MIFIARSYYKYITHILYLYRLVVSGNVVMKSKTVIRIKSNLKNVGDIVKLVTSESPLFSNGI